jgi:mRNA interferase MazF
MIGASRMAKKLGKQTHKTPHAPKGAYQPDRGDFVHLDFTPHAGTEQAGRRPAIVLSSLEYNIATGLLVACPITSQVKGSPWEVVIPATARVKGVILSNQFRSLDWLARNVEYHTKAPSETVNEVLARIEAILGIG